MEQVVEFGYLYSVIICISKNMIYIMLIWKQSVLNEWRLHWLHFIPFKLGAHCTLHTEHPHNIFLKKHLTVLHYWILIHVDGGYVFNEQTFNINVLTLTTTSNAKWNMNENSKWINVLWCQWFIPFWKL